MTEDEMEAQIETTTSETNGGAAWSDVADASAAKWEEGEEYEDVERFPITDGDKLRIDDELVLLRARLVVLKGEWADLKTQAKDKKAAIDGVLSEMDEHHRTLGSPEVTLKGRFKPYTCCAQNAVRVVHVETGREKTRALEDAERQLELVADKMLGAIKPDEGDGQAADAAAIDDPEALLNAAKLGDALAEDPEDESLDSEDDGEDDS